MYQRIRFLREKYNFSIYDISQKLNITFNLYMQYENGKKKFLLPYFQKLQKFTILVLIILLKIQI